MSCYKHDWRKATPERIAKIKAQEHARWVRRRARPGEMEKSIARGAAWRQENKERALEHARRWAKTNPENGRKGARVRRARLANVTTIPYRESDIFDRDMWTCGICLEPIDPLIPRKHPRGASVDHVRPIALGGSDTPDNVQAAHFGCNARKGARAA